MGFGGRMGGLPSVMSHSFSQVPSANIPRSSFNRSHGLKTTFDAGYLIPVFLDEVLPGDTFNLRMTTFARLATALRPVMDNMFCESFFFFVPNRLIWNNWQKFNGEQANPGDSTSFLVPTATTPAGGAAVGSLFDYFGIPTVGQVGGGNTITFDAFWHRAYNLIWNEWFRDQNLQNSVTVDKGDGPDTYSNYTLLRRGKRHDYFTSSLPWPQKGTAVTLPLGTSAPVKGNGTGIDIYAASATDADKRALVMGTAGSPMIYSGASLGANSQAKFSTTTVSLFADLSAATASTVNALRQAFQIQKLYERDARGGTRYTEIIRSHFGVISPDARLQRPEYLGGGSSPITMQPIPQTGGSGASGTTTPQGNLTATGTFSHSGHGFSKSFTEHGVILGLVSVRADLTYQQGIDRMWNRQTRWDFYWPALSHIGEQAVLNKEIYADGSANDALTFGYQERYAEYRYKPSRITGLFRSTSASTLDIWHLSEKFTALPSLNSSFIQSDPPIDRVIATPSEPHFLFDAFFDLKCARPMPTYSVPGLIDHF